MTRSPLGTRKNKLIFATCWLVWSTVYFIILLNWDFPWPTTLADTALANVLLAGASLLVSNTLRYYRPQKGKYLYIIILCTTFSIIWVGVVKFGLEAIFKSDTSYLIFLKNSLPVRFSIGILVTGYMALISELWYTLEERTENESRKTAAEKMSKDAELYKLRQQLQPHFLFNSLNSISALVGTQPEQARKMIQQLSDFLRGTLKREENQWTSLGDELQHLQLYLDIEKVRFGHRLNAEIISDLANEKLLIPHMLLQPVVENAIKFGLYDTTEDVTISIEAIKTDNMLTISVQNPFDPETSSPKQGTGFGLSSTKRRLYLLFARNDLLNTMSNENIFTTIIKIPQA